MFSSIDISNNKLNESEELQQGLRAVLQLNTLLELNLKGNSLGNSTFQIITEYMATNPTLQRLDFSENCLLDEGTVQFARGLQV